MSINATVIIPIFNAEKYIGKCLDCLINQSERNLEIICVNDGSTDNTSAILSNYIKRDSRIRVINQENKGAGEARNLGLKAASGKYVIFLDSDDIFEKNMVEYMLKKAEDTDSDIVVCNSDAFSDNTGNKIETAWRMPENPFRGKDVFSPCEMRDILFQMVQGWPWDKLFRTDFIRECDLKYPNYPNSQDLVFVFEALCYADKISIVEDVLVHRRMENNLSISNSRDKAWEYPYKAVMAVREALKEKNLIDLYDESLSVWSLDFMLWHLNTLSCKSKKKCYNALQKEWSYNLRLRRISRYKCQKSQYIQLKIISHFPYWIYSFLKKAKQFLKGMCKV